jgi:hypothetical protein
MRPLGREEGHAMIAQNDNADLRVQLDKYWRLICRYLGRPVRAFVKVRGQDKYRTNPIIAPLRAARDRLEAAGYVVEMRDYLDMD